MIGGNARETMGTVRRYSTIGYNFEFKLINNNEALRVNTLHRKTDFTFCKSIFKRSKRLIVYGGPKMTRDTDVQLLHVNSSHTFLIRIILFSYYPISSATRNLR